VIETSGVVFKGLIRSTKDSVWVILMPWVHDTEVFQFPELQVKHEYFQIQDNLIHLHIGIGILILLDTAVNITEDGNQ
jgi:hypothetical protein